MVRVEFSSNIRRLDRGLDSQLRSTMRAKNAAEKRRFLAESRRSLKQLSSFAMWHVVEDGFDGNQYGRKSFAGRGLVPDIWQQHRGRHQLELTRCKLAEEKDYRYDREKDNRYKTVAYKYSRYYETDQRSITTDVLHEQQSSSSIQAKNYTTSTPLDLRNSVTCIRVIFIRESERQPVHDMCRFSATSCRHQSTWNEQF